MFLDSKDVKNCPQFSQRQQLSLHDPNLFFNIFEKTKYSMDIWDKTNENCLNNKLWDNT